jgi:hypothetical protein
MELLQFYYSRVRAGSAPIRPRRYLRSEAVEALYFAKTGDVAYREAAFRSYNWGTYFQGLSRDAHSPFRPNGGLPTSMRTVHED